MKIVALVFSLFLMGCSSVLYYPTRVQHYNPAKFDLNPENIYFTNKEKLKLHGWWFDSKAKPAKGTFVFFHGNGENLSSHFASLSWLPDAGYNYFIFDYPGYGQSQGVPGPYENVSSGQAALRWVHEHKDSSPLIIYGQSMGGIVAMRTIIEEKNQVPVKVMIADGTFSSFQRIARKKLSSHWLTWIAQPFAYLLLSDRWAPDVEKISPIPMIVIHGRIDPVIEFEHGERVYKDAGEPKVFIEVPEGQHGNLFWVADGKYRQLVLDQVEKY